MGARRRVGVAHDHPVVGAVGMVAQDDLRGHRHRLRVGRPPSAVDRVGEHDPLARLDGEEAGVEVGHERDPVLAHRGDERAARHDVEPLDPALRRGRQPPRRELGAGRSTPPTRPSGARMTRSIRRSRSGSRSAFMTSSWGLVTNCSRRSVRPSQMARCSASQPSTTARRSRSSVHVRTRPAFAVRISPRALEHPDVLHERRERHRRRPRQIADARRAPARARRSRARRVGSESAPNTSSSRAEYCAIMAKYSVSHT